MAAIQNRTQSQGIEQYISNLKALGNDVELKERQAGSASSKNLAQAQAELDLSQLKYQNAATVVKKMLDFMKELLQMFSR